MNQTAEGAARHEAHQGQASHRPLSEGYEDVGVAGEIALSAFSGMARDSEIKPGGDGNIDGHIYLKFSVDVKTARKPYNLIVEVGKSVADIMILSGYRPDGSVELLGWEWGRVLLKAPSKDFGKGVINHYIPRGELKPMSELSERMLNL